LVKSKARDVGGDPILLGWREWVSLPSLGVERIKAKVDTGARTSSLHAYDIRTFERDGVAMVEFGIHPDQNHDVPAILCTEAIHDRRTIASSNGQSEDRIVIRTDILVSGRRWPIEITLANRDEMGFRMLLGREAVRGRAVVDPGVSYRAGKKNPDQAKGPNSSTPGESSE
jgi:hypothetical protein